MDWITLVVGGLVGAAFGAVIMFYARRAAQAGLEARFSAVSDNIESVQAALVRATADADQWRRDQQSAEIEKEKAQSLLGEKSSRATALEARVSELTDIVTKMTAEKSELATSLKNQGEAHKEKVEALTAIRGEIEKDLKNLANDALKSNQTSFLEIANQVLEKHKEVASGDLTKRQDAIKSMLAPISRTLDEYQKNLSVIEKARHESYGNLSKELQIVIQTQTEVRTETGKLVNALRAAPKTRGRWGEETLKNVMELSGMAQFCDFNLEQSFDTEDGKLRPDVIIRLPGERFIVVDAKTSTSAYMDAIEADNDAEREVYLKQHAQQIRTHMMQLASKSYHDGLTVTPDCVAMFIPGDNFFAAAMEHDPALFEDAVSRKVLIVTPTTLIALAKAIAFGWRQEKVADNAKQIAELGRDLYKRLATMGTHVAGIGGDIERLSKRYNSFVGSMEASVMPQARKFIELEVEGAGKGLPELAPLETDIRDVRRDRDLEFPEASEIKQLEPRKSAE